MQVFSGYVNFHGKKLLRTTFLSRKGVTVFTGVCFLQVQRKLEEMRRGLGVDRHQPRCDAVQEVSHFLASLVAALAQGAVERRVKRPGGRSR